MEKITAGAYVPRYAVSPPTRGHAFSTSFVSREFFVSSASESFDIWPSVGHVFALISISFDPKSHAWRSEGPMPVRLMQHARSEKYEDLEIILFRVRLGEHTPLGFR